jgi:aspartyl-tRNA(Asn)/glutamyl-tRNA(Gln) amidotransferase subunit C
MQIQDLQETADLAHLNLDETELSAAFPAFEQMLGYFAAMQAADKDESAGVIAGHPEGMAASSRLVSAGYFRTDTVNPSDSSADPHKELSENMLSKAGERDGRFVVIPNVL